MIANFSPLSRQLIAVGLLVLTILMLILVVIAPLGSAMSDSFDRLQQARERVARADALISAPTPEAGDRVAAKYVIVARTRAAAMTVLQGSLSAAAASVQLPAPNCAPLSASNAEISIGCDLNAAGRETDLVRFLAVVEATNPAIRFQSWTIIAPDAAGSSAHLQARARAVWRKGA